MLEIIFWTYGSYPSVSTPVLIIYLRTPWALFFVKSAVILGSLSIFSLFLMSQQIEQDKFPCTKKQMNNFAESDLRNISRDTCVFLIRKCIIRK